MAPTKNPIHRPAVKTAVAREQHPSSGNRYAYSHEFRQFGQYMKQNGLHLHPMIRQAQRLHLFMSPTTVNRHNRRGLTLGNLRRFVKQGNRRATVLRGIDLYNLALWRTVWPKSTHAEFNTLLFNSQVAHGENNPRLFASEGRCPQCRGPSLSVVQC